MHLTPLHLTYWRERQRQPTWARLIKRRTRAGRVSIDQVVNCHDPSWRRTAPEPQNTLDILRSARRHQLPLVSVLQEMASGTHLPAMPGQKRAAMAKRWLRRIEADSQR